MNKVNTELDFSEEQAMLLDTAQEFCAARSPIEKVRSQLGSKPGYAAAIWQEMVELGWAGIALPESVGGSDMGVGSVVPVIESMGKAMLGTPLISTTLAGQLIVRTADEKAKQQWLPDLAAGKIATVALLDTFDWGAGCCALEVIGDTLVGTKVLVTDASQAEIFVVSASQNGKPILIILSADQLAEDAISEHVLIDETKRAATVAFSGVQVRPEQIIKGDSIAKAIEDVKLIGALLAAAEATGSAASCLNTTVEYLKTRKQFGKLIGSYQALKHPAVDILNLVDSSRSFIYHAASVVGQGDLTEDAMIACHMAKAQATETLSYASDRCVQFHGGMGFTYECDAQLYIRRGQWIRQQFGDALHHRKRLATYWLG